MIIQLWLPTDKLSQQSQEYPILFASRFRSHPEQRCCVAALNRCTELLSPCHCLSLLIARTGDRLIRGEIDGTAVTKELKGPTTS